MRQDNFAITVTVDDENLGVFQTFSGGESEAESTKNRPGAMEPEESLGGPTSVANVTTGRRFRPDRDAAIEARLHAKCGRAKAVVKKQPLDPDRNPYGQPRVYTGTLIRVAGPESDSNSADVAMLELEVECNGTIA